jgi:type IV pilus assembly protein PilA
MILEKGEGNMFKRFLKNEKGLTLIELLAVIVILGIIAAIAVPSIGGLINKTKEDAVKADAVQLLNAAKLYATTNVKTIEAAGSDGVVLTKGQGANPTADTGELDEYLDNPPDAYSIKIVKSGKNIVYSNIYVKKGSIKKYFDTEQNLLDSRDSTVPSNYQ